MERINITAPASDFKAWRKLAEKSEMSLSEYIRTVMNEHRNVYTRTVATNSEQNRDNP